MSTQEILLLLKVLPRLQREHPDWLTDEERTVLERLTSELLGV